MSTMTSHMSHSHLKIKKLVSPLKQGFWRCPRYCWWCGGCGRREPSGRRYLVTSSGRCATVTWWWCRFFWGGPCFVSTEIHSTSQRVHMICFFLGGCHQDPAVGRQQVTEYFVTLDPKTHGKTMGFFKPPKFYGFFKTNPYSTKWKGNRTCEELPKGFFTLIEPLWKSKNCQLLQLGCRHVSPLAGSGCRKVPLPFSMR